LIDLQIVFTDRLSSPTVSSSDHFGGARQEKEARADWIGGCGSAQIFSLIGFFQFLFVALWEFL
jgi:hypothetical protein